MEKYVVIYRLSKIDHKHLRDAVDKDKLKEEFLSLGLQHQLQSTRNVTRGGEIIKEYKEIASGKSDKFIKILDEALLLCRREGAHIVVSTVDRLARVAYHVHRIMYEMEQAGLRVIFSDAPNADKMYVAVLAAQAEKELELISKRQKDAYNMSKKFGTRTGNPYGNPILRRDPGLYNHYRRQAAIKSHEKANENVNRRMALNFIYGLYHASRDKRIRDVARVTELLNKNKYLNQKGREFTYHGTYSLFRLVANGTYKPTI